MPENVETDRGAVETPIEKDEFAEAFDVAQGLDEHADLSAADDPAKMEEPLVVVPPATPPVKEPPPASEQQPGESNEKYEQRYKTLQGIHKHDKETWEAERVQLLSDLEEAKKPKEVTPPSTPEKTAAAATFVDSLTDEQKQQLADYEQDFDVVSKMEGIKRGVELEKLRREMQAWKEEVASKIAEQATSLDTRIAPVLKREEENERDTHFSTIREGYTLKDGTTVPGHNDFEKYRDDGSLLAWIESKPKYIQPALKETYSKGAAIDVIDLISDFKKENNIPLTPASNVIQMDAAKAARKQALSTVTNRRGAVNVSGAAPPDDFESAFDEALNK